MNKNIVITQSNYIPWKGYFDAIAVADEFVIYDDMQYTRRDWRNRNLIKTHQGVKWLTIPVVVKGKYFQKINETRVSDKNWAKEHWKAISLNYAKSPFFKDYKDIFEDLYLTLQTEWLTEINFKFICKICAVLSIYTPIKFSSEFILAEDRTQRLVDICKKLNGTDYYSGPAAKAYMDVSRFEAEKINVHYFDYSGYPEYLQLYGQFVHGLTVLDLIFNVGPEASKYMKFAR
jgi:hypothetical protein